jgi:undecaprenyl-diphosphatase
MYPQVLSSMNPQILNGDTLYITFMASFLLWIMFVGLLALWIIDGKVKQEIVVHTIISVILAWVAADLFKEIFPTLRPYHVNGMTPLTITKHHLDGSFPSSHTSVAFALAVSVFLHNRKIGLIFLASAFGVGIGRVLSFVHYPIDILGGAVFGCVIAYSMEKVHVMNIVNKFRA